MPSGQLGTVFVVNRFIRYVLFFAALGFLLATWPRNRTEADFAFEWARMAEAGGPVLLHPFNLLYPVMARTLYAPLQAIGWPGRAYPLLCLFSAVCAAGTVVVFARFCYRRYSMRPASSLVAAFLLLFSYGFWRYATEASASVPAILMILLALYYGTEPRAGARHMALAAVFAAVAACLHVVNLIPALVGIPGACLARRERKALGVYLLVLALLLGAVVGAVAAAQPLERRLGAPFAGVTSAGGPRLLRPAVGFGQALASGNFLLRFAGARRLLADMFPHRMLGEEFYLGMHAPSRVPWFPFLTLGLLVFLAVGSAVRSVRLGGGFGRDRANGAPSHRVLGGAPVLVAVGLWFAVSAAAVALYEPGNPEGWVMALPAFWLLVCGWVIVPLAQHRALWLPAALALLLLVHNVVGGIGMLRDPAGDYNARKTAWILAHAKPGDVILTAENPVFLRYLRYRATDVTVLDLRRVPPDALDATVAQAAARGGRLYALSDVFEQPVSQRVRFPKSSARISAFAAVLRPDFRQVAWDEFGGVWERSAGEP